MKKLILLALLFLFLILPNSPVCRRFPLSKIEQMGLKYGPSVSYRLYFPDDELVKVYLYTDQEQIDLASNRLPFAFYHQGKLRSISLEKNFLVEKGDLKELKIKIEPDVNVYLDRCESSAPLSLLYNFMFFRLTLKKYEIQPTQGTKDVESLPFIIQIGPP